MFSLTTEIVCLTTGKIQYFLLYWLLTVQTSFAKFCFARAKNMTFVSILTFLHDENMQQKTIACKFLLVYNSPPIIHFKNRFWNSYSNITLEEQPGLGILHCTYGILSKVQTNAIISRHHIWSGTSARFRKQYERNVGKWSEFENVGDVRTWEITFWCKTIL